MHPKNLLIVLLAGTVAAGCHPATVKPEEPVPASPNAQPSGTESEEQQPLALAEPVVTLLDPGAEPRAPLRYQFEVGEPQTMVVLMDMTMSMGISGRPASNVTLPTAKIEVSLTPKEIMKSGDLRYEFILKHIEAVARDGVPEHLVAEYGKQLQAMQDASGWVVVSPRGVNKEFAFSSPAHTQVRQLTERMGQSLRNANAPFPVEAVGVGARWQVVNQFVSSPIHGHQTTTYRLKARTGSHAVLEATVVQEVPPQDVQFDQMPPGTVAKLTSFNGTGNAQTTVDLESLVPTSTGSVGLMMTLRTEGEGQSVEMTLKIAVDTTIEPGQ